VPGLIGSTDFASGAVPLDSPLGWFSLVNPREMLVYLNFFTGPAAKAEDDLILYFNELWMQYGGRPFTPWALYDGGTDGEFCLGLENAVSAYAYGLDHSRTLKTLMDSPCTATIPPRSTRVLRYGTLFSAYENSVLDEGITTVDADADHLTCIAKGAWKFKCDASFSLLKALEKRL
jgi:hypothetical protein